MEEEDYRGRAPSFDEKERERCISKCKREEAKITAWENLQKAKAEAAIRKLEMKLEKKRNLLKLWSLKSADRQTEVRLQMPAVAAGDSRNS
ncbi:hypothetical protein ZWY2020_022832 [Hordeum vulgare]|nr:hypothetical protein ZWY2020_022832 [Hordeum vulgare]